MRSIARQSIRLANRPARSSSRSPRLPQIQQHARCISQTTPLRADPRNPPGSSDHSAPIDSRREEDHRKEHERRIAGQEKSTAETKSTEAGKPSPKTYKQRRSEKAQKFDVPKPPPVPDWFLRHNVKLQAENLGPNREAKNAQVLRCVDKDTGHTLFVLPYYEAWPVPGLPGRTDQQCKAEPNASHKVKPLEHGFFANKFEPQPALQMAEKSTQTSETSKIQIAPSVDPYSDINPHSLLRWSLLEAESSIHAAFLMATSGPHSNLHAASSVDISLNCADCEAHEEMDELVEDLANLTQSDVIRLDANDFEDLLFDYVESGSDAPGTFSRLAYDVFHGAAAVSQSDRSMEDIEIDDEDIDEDEAEEDERGARTDNAGPTFSLGHVLDKLVSTRHDIGQGFSQIKGTGALVLATANPGSNSGSRSPFRSISHSEPIQLDEARLKILIDSLLDASKEKREQSAPQTTVFRSRLLRPSKDRPSRPGMAPSDISHQALWRVWRSSPGCWLPDVAGVLAGRVSRAHNDESSPVPIKLEAIDGASTEGKTCSHTRRTIVHVRDLKDIARSPMGQIIIRHLIKSVKKRRKAGQEILIVGTTAQEAANPIFAGMTNDASEQGMRNITIPSYFRLSKEEQSRFGSEDFDVDTSEDGSYGRILEINLRHLNSMLQRLRPGDPVDLFAEKSQAQLQIAGANPLSQRVLSFDLIQRIVLTAIGLSRTHAMSDAVNATHVALAMYATVMADKAARVWTNRKVLPSHPGGDTALPQSAQASQDIKAGPEKMQARMDKLKKSCNQHESKLLAGVVDPQNIKTGFKEVHAPAETIDALKMMTSLSLLRPDAFKYGVLAADRLPGLMLYGPPGTGKTLLAKAVAKESRATVLEISGAQIYEKYVGEGEKMVRAVFSLAKKLSPCIVFIDEADAIFGSRSGAGNRNTHREIINQFLREWDGMELHNVFIMVASNRPFDMDDAVLRRLPRRLLVDLPVAKDRESILKIHLRDEALDDSVNLTELSEKTPLYSGSDLKNLCVAAALACVREENELAESKQDEKDFKLPEKRTLSSRHFERAIREISASISEDMSSLTAIKKFDEQYGDRRGRRKKAAYGFGLGEVGVDENAVRVRDTPRPSL